MRPTSRQLDPNTKGRNGRRGDCETKSEGSAIAREAEGSAMVKPETERVRDIEANGRLSDDKITTKRKNGRLRKSKKDNGEQCVH